MLHLIRTILFPVMIGCAAVSLVVGTACKLAPKAQGAFKKKKKKSNKKSSNKQLP